MILGIDASNLRAGGGVTHLVEMLRAAEPGAHGFSKVLVWSGQATLNQIEEHPWLMKVHQPLLDKNLLFRTFWQRFRLTRLVRMAGCDVLFVPGGSFSGVFHPVVTMSQNMLPFEWRELRRYACSLVSARLILLRFTQTRTLRRAEGVAFLTLYARDQVMRIVKFTSGHMAIIPHGVDARFTNSPREQRPIEQYSYDRPFRIVYVSIIDVYKHQWQVADAVAMLRQDGLPVVVDFVGPAYAPALRRLRDTLDRVDPAGAFVRYLGPVPHDELHMRYKEADLCLFASSCENMPNILLEGMASGLPIACSNRGPMPEVLGDAGVYFDPETPNDIARALQELICSPEMRDRLANDSFRRAQLYSWHRCAGETFEFLADVARTCSARR